MKKKDVCIIDYGLGNVNSVKNEINLVGVDCIISGDKREISGSKYLILPGVGSFSQAMKNLEERNLIQLITDEVLNRKKKILGICLGMQLFATTGYEYGIHKGLNFVKGKVVEIDNSQSKLRLPHIGWNDVKLSGKHILIKGFVEDPIFYFVHSYHFVPEDKSVIAGTCDYGEKIVAIIEHDNIFGTQFHPEKSHTDGIQILNNFLDK
jgi:imidazole glycerol-phosphate synthase subunit HisH